MYTFHYQLTLDDHFDHRLCLNYTLPAFRKKIMMQKYLNPLLFIVWAILLGFIFGHFPNVYIFSGAISIGWILIFRKRVVRNIHKSLKITSESGKSPFNSSDVVTVFDEEKIRTDTVDSEASFNYSAIEKIVTGPNALYLYINATTAFILPYRIFASEEEKDSFLQFIKEKTNAPVIAGVTK